jgi:photosystem II stability/assembly factor-like uncharacterized protein
MKHWFCLIIHIALTSLSIHAQNFSVQVLTEGTASNIRGVSTLNDSLVWVSGSHGWYAKSEDAGKSWQWKQLKGYEKLDFRAIKVLDKGTVVMCNAGSPAYIFKTTDGGENWKIVYTNRDSLAFIDALDFWDKQNGIALGDPVDGKFMILLTNDGGLTWTQPDKTNLPPALNGEAAFAASGTCLRTFGNTNAYFVSGGKASRLFQSKNKGKTWSVVEAPMLHGSAPQGTFSIAIKDEKNFYISGGDYERDTLSVKNYFYTLDAGKTWKASVYPPRGYRSCIELIDQTMLIATGTSGTDVSTDNGKNWKSIGKESYNTANTSPAKKTVYLAGENGRIAKVIIMKTNKDLEEINKVLEMQSVAWNEGDVEKYMEGYWNSDSLSFIGKNGITKGWKATLERYKKAYPDKAAMGRLTFTLLSEEALGKENYMVVGKWHLQREKDEVGGHFTLIWKKVKGKWKIMSDHTS